MKLFLIDAYALIYRSYYAFIKNPRINSKGMNTSAIFGFVNSLEDVLKRENPTHIAVGFDPSGPTFRHEAYEEYKAQREETPEAIRESVPIIKQIIEAYNIPILEVPRFEADDVIATVAIQAEKEGFDVYMMTPDKDYGQLVSDHIFIYRPKFGGGYETMGTKEVLEKFSISSVNQVIDILGLMGDSSDNIPGCPGVGEKTAAKLIEEFHSIENLLENTDKLKGALQTKISENKEQIRFSKFLATIVTDVPIQFDAQKCILEKPDNEKLKEIYTELEFRTFINKLNGESKPAAPKNIPIQGSLFAEFAPEEAVANNDSSLASLQTTLHKYHIADTEEKRKQLNELLSKQKEFAFDTETDGINPLTAHLVGLSFAIKENEAWYVPVPADMEEATKIVSLFSPTLQNKEIGKIGQNIKFDILVLRKYNIYVAGLLFDTMIAHYLLNPELRHGMDYLAETYLKYKPIPIEELIGPKGKNQLSMRNVALEKIADYAAEDADITLKLKNYFEPELKKQGIERLFYDIEMPLVYVLADMEANGVKLDTAALKQSSEELTKELIRLEKEIHEMAGMEFNINSAKQVGEVLFDHMKIEEKAKKTKTGSYSTSEDILEKLRSKHPIIGKLLEYRGLKKLLSTYIDALPELINPQTGKVHTSFNQTVTATGRLSSTNPNLQNIPIRDEMGREIRKAFIPENENCLFFSADYSQIELRIMAHLSKDENMVSAFRSGADIHAATAAKIYGVDIKDVTKDMRRKAKTANFGIIYGISVFGLAERLSIPRAEAKELIDGYFRTYPDVRAYMDESIEVAKEHGYVETIFKRKRFLPDIHSNNAIVRGYAERNAINAPIQGSAADIIKVAMARIFNRFEKEGLKSKMILQVHDELNFNVYKEEMEKVRQIVLEEMEGVIKLEVPLIADCGEGKNWLEAH
ncbi:DNA polymerase-1 [Parabacteroides sp. PF5-5]|uniref:DNA polymerase I n=1 Tax=unclassified Parabacteroides TaxID=2649774 RepID=UPI00247318B2|nr:MULTISPECIES: DNA polymerase I [unclassified Parabacteroides]MDH6305981.1 DNA polymerase-1 [Parabacteroides sp. PH5-39]MDH6317237.1 DNA polymerase-1 [Parabacteroides sp. PF5-13]MDH6320693.1 DNA polymerase-1 [Parabacteroides sp. PH5-13]MDH6324386.1 DNA polymerase-1 [Parabacteroides sp. PH5-8]MDH6328422.1 DNA polymerase-1 [Parabacteroides sp. PH5-41]